MKIAVTTAVLASAACMLLGLYCLYLKNRIKKVEAERERQLSELEEKLQDEYSVRMVDKQAKLSALQSQINPHFCIIRWSASGVRHFSMTVTVLPEWPRHWHPFSAIVSARRRIL